MILSEGNWDDGKCQKFWRLEFGKVCQIRTITVVNGVCAPGVATGWVVSCNIVHFAAE